MSMFYELMMRKKEEIMYATIKGTLTENDGVFTGFTDSNYLQLQQQFTLSPTTKAEFCFKINVSSFDDILSVFCGSDILHFFYFGVNNSKKIITAFGDGSNWTNLKTGNTILSLNTDYEIKIKIDNNVATVYVNGNTELNFNIGLETANTFNVRIGKGRSTNDYFSGSIDLPNSYIKLGATKYNLQSVYGYKIVGTLMESPSGVFSGFSRRNYINIPYAFPFLSSNNWKIIIKATTTYNGNQQQRILNDYLVRGLGNPPEWSVLISDNNQINYVGIIENYNWFKIERKGNTIYLSSSADGITYTNNKTKGLTDLSDSSYIRYGNASSQTWTGQLYLKDCLIYNQNKLWFNGQEG